MPDRENDNWWHRQLAQGGTWHDSLCLSLCLREPPGVLRVPRSAAHRANHLKSFEVFRLCSFGMFPETNIQQLRSCTFLLNVVTHASQVREYT